MALKKGKSNPKHKHVKSAKDLKIHNWLQRMLKIRLFTDLSAKHPAKDSSSAIIFPKDIRASMKEFDQQMSDQKEDHKLYDVTNFSFIKLPHSPIFWPSLFPRIQ